MSATTVKVSNVSFKASEHDLKEFFLLSGDVLYVEVKSEDEGSQTAYVTFKDPQGAETAVLLTGATVGDKVITVTLDPNYQLPPDVLAQLADGQNQGAESAFHKAEDVFSSLLAKSYIYGMDALTRAKSFDEKHRLTSTALTKISSFNERMRLSEKINEGTSVVNTKMKEMDEKYQVVEKTKTTYAVVEERVSTAGSAMMKNPYVQSGATWVSDASNRVAKAAEEVGEKTKEKMREEQMRKMVDDDEHKVRSSESDPREADSSDASPKVATLKAVSPKGKASPKGTSPKVEASGENDPSKPKPGEG